MLKVDRVLKVPLVLLEHKDIKDTKEFKVLLVLKVLKEDRVLKVSKVLPEQAEVQGRKALKVPLELKVSKVSKVFRVFRVVLHNKSIFTQEIQLGVNQVVLPSYK